jgi:hypothetical protein
MYVGQIFLTDAQIEMVRARFPGGNISYERIRVVFPDCPERWETKNDGTEVFLIGTGISKGSGLPDGNFSAPARRYFVKKENEITYFALAEKEVSVGPSQAITLNGEVFPKLSPTLKDRVFSAWGVLFNPENSGLVSKISGDGSGVVARIKDYLRERVQY